MRRRMLVRIKVSFLSLVKDKVEWRQPYLGVGVAKDEQQERQKN